MIWEQQVDVIAMVTLEREGGKVRGFVPEKLEILLLHVTFRSLCNLVFTFYLC